MRMSGVIRKLMQYSVGQDFAARVITRAHRLAAETTKAAKPAGVLAVGFWGTGVHCSENRGRKADLNYETLAKKNTKLLGKLRERAIVNFINGKEVIDSELLKYCQAEFVLSLVASPKPNNVLREKHAISFAQMALIKIHQEIIKEYKQHFDNAMKKLTKEEAPRVKRASDDLAAAYHLCQMNDIWLPKQLRCKADARVTGRAAFFNITKVVVDNKDPLVAKAYKDAQRIYSEKAYAGTIKELSEEAIMRELLRV